MDKSSYVQDYEPGDHVAVYPQNEARLVEGIAKYVKDPGNVDVTYQVERAAKGNYYQPVADAEISPRREILTTVHGGHLFRRI